MNTDLQSPDSIVLRCPGCGKANACTLGAHDQDACVCSRCSCELTPLVAVAHTALTLRASANLALQRGNYEVAMDLALKSWELKHGAATARVGLLASLALGETEAASSWAASIAACA